MGDGDIIATRHRSQDVVKWGCPVLDFIKGCWTVSVMMLCCVGAVSDHDQALCLSICQANQIPAVFVRLQQTFVTIRSLPSPGVMWGHLHNKCSVSSTAQCRCTTVIFNHSSVNWPIKWPQRRWAVSAACLQFFHLEQNNWEHDWLWSFVYMYNYNWLGKHLLIREWEKLPSLYNWLSKIYNSQHDGLVK